MVTHLQENVLNLDKYRAEWPLSGRIPNTVVGSLRIPNEVTQQGGPRTGRVRAPGATAGSSLNIKDTGGAKTIGLAVALEARF